MKEYLKLLQTILDYGVEKQDRTGTGTKSIFGYQMRFNLEEGFPLLTTKRLPWRSIVVELLWFIRGETNLRYLHEHNVHIWDAWANQQGELGPIYGRQWRSWGTSDGGTIDQLKDVIARICHDPDSRRLIVSSWNVAEIEHMALPPCHTLFQFYVANDTLSCQLYQRSADVFIGVPFNIASYALLTLLIAHVTGKKAGEFIHTFGDAHLYKNHIDQVRLQQTRTPRSLPKIKINSSFFSIEKCSPDDFVLEDYHPCPHIKAPVAV